jgi:hypothetical protein
MLIVTLKTTYGGHTDMLGIPFIDVPLASIRVARSALPHAPVIEDERGRRFRGGRRRRTAIGSRQG